MKHASILILALGLAACTSPSLAYFTDAGYQSPYSVQFSVSPEELLEGNGYPPRNDWHLESKTPYEDWYSDRVRREFGSWGPDPKHFPALPNSQDRSPSWKRQRVLAVGYQLIGLPYQHHHLPDWDPPADWPWKPVKYGRNSKGMDCSDFTAWMYNYGLGIHLHTGIEQQAETKELAGPGGEGSIQVDTIHNDNGYEELVHKLKTGDLLYIRNKKGKIGHVIMWVGAHGQSPDGTPIIIDCTGPDHKDANGNTIPIGVRLRPFVKDGWYYKSFAHAHRILKD